MRHVYHVPEEIGPAAGDDSAVARAVRAAVLRGVAGAVQELVGDRSEPEVVSPVRPPARWRVGPDAGTGERWHVAVPSYQDRGRPVAVPVGAHPVAHPVVTAVNEIAVLVRRAEQAPPVLPAPPAGAGILGRMWARGAAEDAGRLLRPSRADLEQAEGRLVGVVGAEALRIAKVLLDRNEVVARREAARYGEAKAAGRLRAAATEMAMLQRQILDRVRDAGNVEQAGIPGAPLAGRPLAPSNFDDILAGSVARGDSQVRRDLLPRLNTLKRIYGPEFPILLGHNLDYARFAVADPARLGVAVGTTTSDVLKSIERLRSRLTGETVWQLAPVLEAARHLLGVVPGTPAAAALDRYLAQRRTDEAVRRLLLTALSVTLGIAATVATAGAAAPGAGAGIAALAGGLSLTTAGVSVFDAVEHYENHAVEHAAAHSSLDAATALVHEDPSVAWLAVSVLGAVTDVGAAIVAVRNLARLARSAMATRQLAALEQAARAQARVLAAEGRLATGEQEFADAVLGAARREIGGADGTLELRYGSYVFARNPGGPRSVQEAARLARERGVDIGEDVLIGVDHEIGSDMFAYYGHQRLLSTDTVTWRKLTNELVPLRPGGRPTYWTAEPIEKGDRLMIVRLHPEVLKSDEAIVAVLAHEMHEINHLRARLEDGESMSAAAYLGLVNGKTGSLHLEAWRVALTFVDRMRAAPR